MQNLREIANGKLRDNRGFREQMLSLIGRGEAIAFVGAGLSVPLEYPAWPKLLSILSEEANRVGPFKPSNDASMDALFRAEEIQQHFEKHGAMAQFRNILGRQYGPGELDNCTPTHLKLVRLPFRAFVTTNYEECVEQALIGHAVSHGKTPRTDYCVIIKSNAQDRHRVSAFLRSLMDDRDLFRRHVAHVHGCYNDVENIIISASDYARAYGFTLEQGRILKNAPVSTLHRQLVWSLFASRRMVFFGCSMDDPYLMALLEAVSTDLWEWTQSTHFVVLPLDQSVLGSIDNQIAAFGRYGLQVVLFDNWDGTFLELDKLLDEAYQVPPQEIVVAPRPAVASASLARRDSNRTAPAPPGVTDWLEDVNRITAPSLRKNED